MMIVSWLKSPCGAAATAALRAAALLAAAMWSGGVTPVTAQDETTPAVAAATAAATAPAAEPAPAEDGEEEIVTEVDVHAGQIVRANLHAYVVAYGNVALEPAAQGKAAASVRVASPVAGILTAVQCVQGQRVAKGAVLFRLDDRVAQVAVDKAKQAIEFAEKNLERQKKLQQVEGTSQRLYQEAEQQLQAARAELAAAQTQLDLLTVKAPMAGTVTQVDVKPGESVDSATVLAELKDLDRLVVAANVPSAEIALVKVGMPVEIAASRALPGGAATTETLHHGTLTFIGPEVDSRTDTVATRVEIGPNGELRPGQFVRIRIAYEKHAGRLAVPEDSVVTDDEGHSVIAVLETAAGGDRAVYKPVTLGLRENGLVEIEGEGLNAGTPIVVQDAYGLPKETKVRIIGR